ncbi:hypothetical protein [Lacinutrix undariae]
MYESAINDLLDSWGGWAKFVLAPGASVGWMAAECIEKCHFKDKLPKTP